MSPAPTRGSVVVVRAATIGGGYKIYRIGRVETMQPDGSIRIRLWMGLRWPRGVRWSHTPRTVLGADVVREATARETTLGHVP